MPVTIVTCDVTPEEWPASRPLTTDPRHVLDAASRADSAKCASLIASSFSSQPDAPGVIGCKNGLIEAAAHAWKHHNNLVLRPDDIWICVLSQINFYLNKNAEELRDFFVSHKNKKELVVGVEGTIETADYALFANAMADNIGKNVKDPELKDWIMPDFSTTTAEDRTVAAVLFMGSMQKYFGYSFSCASCAIPRITLLGEKEDWAKLQRRMDKILPWGPEAERYHGDLVPIFKHILASFDDPTSEEVVNFWDKMVSEYGLLEMSGSSDEWVTGWIAGLFLWDEDGIVRGQVRALDEGQYSRHPPLELDGVRYAALDMGSSFIPAVGSVPVKVWQVDGGVVTRELNTLMVAGCAGYRPCVVKESLVAETPALRRSARQVDRGYEDESELFWRQLHEPYCMAPRKPHHPPKSGPKGTSHDELEAACPSSRQDGVMTYVKPAHFWCIFEAREPLSFDNIAGLGFQGY